MGIENTTKATTNNLNNFAPKLPRNDRELKLIYTLRILIPPNLLILVVIRKDIESYHQITSSS